MGNSLQLISGQKYKIIQAFTDYDGITHHINETWVYTETNFLPYEDGLTLHVIKDKVPVVYRFQWRKEQQADIIENFKDFVETC